MALATQSDVEARLGRSINPAEQALVPGLLDEASDLVVGYIGPRARLGPPVPDTVARVVSRMVARVLQTPAGEVGVTLQQKSAGPYQLSNTYNPDSRNGGPWLTKADKKALRPFKLGGFSVRMYEPLVPHPLYGFDAGIPGGAGEGFPWFPD